MSFFSCFSCPLLACVVSLVGELSDEVVAPRYPRIKMWKRHCIRRDFRIWCPAASVSVATLMGFPSLELPGPLGEPRNLISTSSRVGRGGVVQGSAHQNAVGSEATTVVATTRIEDHEHRLLPPGGIYARLVRHQRSHNLKMLPLKRSARLIRWHFDTKYPSGMHSPVEACFGLQLTFSCQHAIPTTSSFSARRTYYEPPGHQPQKVPRVRMFCCDTLSCDVFFLEADHRCLPYPVVTPWIFVIPVLRVSTIHRIFSITNSHSAPGITASAIGWACALRGARTGR